MQIMKFVNEFRLRKSGKQMHFFYMTNSTKNVKFDNYSSLNSATKVNSYDTYLTHHIAQLN